MASGLRSSAAKSRSAFAFFEQKVSLEHDQCEVGLRLIGILLQLFLQFSIFTKRSSEVATTLDNNGLICDPINLFCVPALLGPIIPLW